jgi:hypothetical protein
MNEAAPDQLKRAVEAQHGCTATFIQSVPVKAAFEGETVWDGVVQVFTIHGHPRGLSVKKACCSLRCMGPVTSL